MDFAVWMFTSAVTAVNSFSRHSDTFGSLCFSWAFFSCFYPKQYLFKTWIKKLMPQRLSRARKRKDKLKLLNFSFTSNETAKKKKGGNKKTWIINTLAWEQTAQLLQNLLGGKRGKKRSTETRFQFRITIATERREGKITRLLSQIKLLKEQI